MTSAYLFDLDGTLLDTEIVWVRATSEYLAAKGHPVADVVCMQIVYGRSWIDVYADITAKFPDLDIGLPEMQREMAEFFYKLRDKVDVRIKGSIALLKKLSKTTPCCIVSGSPREHITEAVKLMGIEKCIQFYLGATDYPFGKPNPSGFLAAAERLGVAPGECVVFEDSAVGVAAGKAAGMKVVALSVPGRPLQATSAADLVLSDLSEFDPKAFG